MWKNSFLDFETSNDFISVVESSGSSKIIPTKPHVSANPICYYGFHYFKACFWRIPYQTMNYDFLVPPLRYLSMNAQKEVIILTFMTLLSNNSTSLFITDSKQIIKLFNSVLFLLQNRKFQCLWQFIESYQYILSKIWSLNWRNSTSFKC